jgi:DNA-binding NarL/FixJ family response regulator
LELCEGHSGKIDLLISDVVMPVMGGGELAGELAVARPEIRVLFMSGYTGNAILHHGVLPAHTGILEKPFLTDALARKVREVLDQV